MIIEVYMMKKLSALLLLIAILLSMICGCETTEENKISYKTVSYGYFDTVTTIVGYESSQAKFADECNRIFSILGEYHKLFDIYHEYEGINNLYTVNKLVDGKHQVVKVDRKIIDMLLMAKEMHALTGGKMNIAMGSVLSIWHDYRTEGIDDPSNAQLPPMELLTEAAKHTDINNLIIDEENSTVFLADPVMTLDVGAFAKGYAVEMTARALEAAGKSNYALNVGGNIRTVGGKADGSKWKTGIENPANTEEYIEYVGLKDNAIVTSGSYQRYYTVIVSAKCRSCDWVYDESIGIPEQDVQPNTPPSKITSKNTCPVCGEKIRRTSKQFHHIIDNETLMPSEGLLSVSIICTDSGLGDGLSTALFCMSIEEGMALINSIDGAEAMWVTEDEVVYYSGGFINHKNAQ